MTIEALADELVHAAYLGDGGELPAHEIYYLLHRQRYARITAHILRALAQHPVYEPACFHLRAVAAIAEIGGGGDGDEVETP